MLYCVALGSVITLVAAGCASSSGRAGSSSADSRSEPAGASAEHDKASLEGIFGGAVHCEVTDQAARIAGGLVALRSGHTVCVELDASGGALRVQTLAAAPGSSTLVVRLAVDADGENTLMTLHNPFAQPIKYRAGMKVPGQQDILATSTCPIIAGGAAFEHWPHAMDGVVLADFRLLESGVDRMVCE
ncbi:MAG: hypothetical protein JW940_16190 [Polyangiaceae bacterium]|nr:hypothetical protein [Polyangiaceae bacterium]